MYLCIILITFHIYKNCLVESGVEIRHSVDFQLQTQIIEDNTNHHCCQPEDPMSFTVQTKRAESRDTKWITAGKVTVVLPAMWGRLSGQQKEDYLNQSFSRF